jgi:4-hydroxy-3-polyprenylbenzoate decarboxylase
MNLIVGITGASGIVYGVRLLEELRRHSIKTYLVTTKWADETLKMETDYEIDYVYSLAYKVMDNENLSAEIASGSFLTSGMIIAPCSMKTLSGIANGYADSLIIRAADVTLKERKKLVLLTRETPLSIIHIENMKKATQAGAIIMPPVPSFYTRPKTLDDIVDHTVGRVLDLFEIYENDLTRRWDGGGSRLE